MTKTRAREALPIDTADDQVWRPLVFDPAEPDDAGELELLRRSDRVWRTTDTLAQQVRDLAETRLRKENAPPEAIAAGEREITGGLPLDRFGRWVYYPWSGRLVHLLPPAEFRELRLDRNRHKVTRGEQATLDRLTVGIVGLSVGNAVANTLALEGTCGHLRLADFDHLSLSNLNRIRAGVEAIGLPKTVLAARQILELDPYVSLSLCHAGFAAEAIVDFLTGPPAVDVVIDECDDLRLKVLLRETARSRGLPVLMATSDRGMMDVERFDLEPDAPALPRSGRRRHRGRHPDQTEHGGEGQAGDGDRRARHALGADRRLDAGDRGDDHDLAPTGLGRDPRRGGDDRRGPAPGARSAAPSGRRYLDMEQALTTDLPIERHRRARAGGRADRGAGGRTASRSSCASSSPTGSWRHRGATANRGASPGTATALLVGHDRARSKNLLDVGHRASYVALGAAIENIRIAAAKRGYTTAIEPFPCRDRSRRSSPR